MSGEGSDQSAIIESRKSAIELAHSSSKQILTLSSTIIVLIVGAILGGNLKMGAPAYLLVGSTLSFLFSTISGVLSLYAISGILEGHLHLTDERPLLTTHYRNFGGLQFLLFVFGIGLMILSVIVYCIRAP